MEEKVKSEIRNLAATIFEDVEYQKAIMYLETGRFNEMRLFVNEKYELLDAICEVSVNPVILTQRNACDRLEDLVINAFLGEKV